MSGLRERKRQRTHDTISATAIRMFLDRGFDAVSVADVADAAEVSKPTLFRYFPTKEDLVLHRIGDHLGEAARIVQGSPEPVDALRRRFLEGLAERDPVTGLNDVPEVLAYHRLVFETPALAARVAAFVASDEEALAAALGDGLVAELRAAQILAVQRVLARNNWRELMAGRTAADLYPEAVVAAEAGFALLQP
ncbi:TetR family transcriptional regulator [Cryptosporangium sp. NPDC048952]|uniref:TetR family transcriptional regulator n=1 Tax=Cryptosporangium sp. NPDC048952 TaxID=3363961 RepID=UPI0037122B85